MLNFSYNSKKNSLTQSYTVYDTSTTFVAFELISSFSMNEVTVKASIGSFDDETKINLAIIILPILFVICVVVAIIIFIYKKNHKKNDNQLQNLTNKTNTQPLYPISQFN